MDPGEPSVNKELRWSTAEFESVLHEFKIFSWRDVHEMYLLILWQIEINVFLGGEFPHPGGKTNGKLGKFCCRFPVFWKNNLPTFLSKMYFFGRKFHNTSTEFLVWGGVCFRNFCTHTVQIQHWGPPEYWFWLPQQYHHWEGAKFPAFPILLAPWISGLHGPVLPECLFLGTWLSATIGETAPNLPVHLAPSPNPLIPNLLASSVFTFSK